MSISGLIPIPNALAILIMIIGMMMIAMSSLFIHLYGSKIRKQHNEFVRFDKVRSEARLVPNDLDEGYIIDYTADLENAIIYTKNRLHIEDEDIQIEPIYKEIN